MLRVAIHVPALLGMPLCFLQLENDAILKAKRLIRVPADKRWAIGDIMWRYDRTSSMEVFKDECNIVLVYWKTATGMFEK